MELGLKGKVAAITGGAGGLGMAMAREFLQEGCSVAICDYNEEILIKAKQTLKEEGYDVLTGVVDVTKKSDICSFIAEIVDTYGKLDIWCNNAGIVIKKAIIEMEEEEWQKVIATNLNSCFLGVQAAANAMIAKEVKGVIINTASINAIAPTCYKSSYAASKAAIVSLTQAAAAELAPYGIRVNAILPAMTETPMMIERLKDEKCKVLLDGFPLRRLGKPEDVAAMAVYLTSERATFLTGASYRISGGQLSVQDPMTAWGGGWTGVI